MLLSAGHTWQLVGMSGKCWLHLVTAGQGLVCSLLVTPGNSWSHLIMQGAGVVPHHGLLAPHRGAQPGRGCQRPAAAAAGRAPRARAVRVLHGRGGLQLRGRRSRGERGSVREAGVKGKALARQ